jgi:hypothetical protein
MIPLLNIEACMQWVLKGRFVALWVLVHEEEEKFLEVSYLLLLLFTCGSRENG